MRLDIQAIDDRIAAHQDYERRTFQQYSDGLTPFALDRLARMATRIEELRALRAWMLGDED